MGIAVVKVRKGGVSRRLGPLEAVVWDIWD